MKYDLIRQSATRGTRAAEIEKGYTVTRGTRATEKGFSVPRNQEIMRIFKDLEMVEHLGSGIPRILEVYSEDCFKFSENFLRMTFKNSWNITEDETTQVIIQDTTPDATPVTTPDTTPVTMQDTMQVAMQVTMQVKELLLIMKDKHSVVEMMEVLNLKNRDNFRIKYIIPCLKSGLIEMTIPQKPNSRFQKYRLTVKGQKLKKELKK